MQISLDTLDVKILNYLLQQGRITWAELAAQIGISAPAAADRVRKLEDRGVIQGYTACLDAERVGHSLTAFIAVTLERPEHRATFLERVHASAAIQECHHVTGDDDYLLKVRCRHTRHLEHLISDSLKSLPGILRTRTTIVLSTVKETAALPVSTSSS
ncbi:Leucine-responsive regulatory protein [Halomicronema hongdechloris C2206]|uniref:Leucine-responsive regulatory protein n=1 Tax=Halomicronema hongdechloris C2206 TaxID=1641165 RepID=A0A1Z3HT38_9CYAN|nr:Lrp/AsnC family transcriptional regulator [Halomicronema hongdechloris]ASC73473.1 Leucine-responsive regulatory protein [Halomicronema hongdechloris C2206]